MSTEASAYSTPVTVASSSSNGVRRSSQRSTSPSRSPLRPLSGKLKQPEWYRNIVEDGNTELHGHQLGLVNPNVRAMCGSVRPQVERIWSERSPHSMLAALVTARHFTHASWSHPTHQQMVDLRQRVHDAVDPWSEERFAAVLSGRTKTEYVSTFLIASSEEPLDLSFLRLFQAVDPAHPTLYVISVSLHDGLGHAFLDSIGPHDEADTHTPCIVLYRHESLDNHFEAVSWKPSRGGTPLTTSFTRTHELIVALEEWKQGGYQPDSSPPSSTRKRKIAAVEVIDVVQDQPSSNGAPLSP